MALNYVTLTLDLSDPTGAPVKSGNVLIGPSDPVTGQGIVISSAVSVNLPAAGTPRATVSLLATDNTGMSPTGWHWHIIYLDPTGRGIGNLKWSFTCLYANGASQNISACATVPGPSETVAL